MFQFSNFPGQTFQLVPPQLEDFEALQGADFGGETLQLVGVQA